jgi:hypothetical protein
MNAVSQSKVTKSEAKTFTTQTRKNIKACHQKKIKTKIQSSKIKRKHVRDVSYSSTRTQSWSHTNHVLDTSNCLYQKPFEIYKAIIYTSLTVQPWSLSCSLTMVVYKQLLKPHKVFILIEWRRGERKSLVQTKHHKSQNTAQNTRTKIYDLTRSINMSTA